MGDAVFLIILVKMRSVRFLSGEKNWLFCDTPNGAQASALVYSMVEMAKANGVNVYLTYLLEKMPSDRMSDEELELLAPWNENVKLRSNTV